MEKKPLPPHILALIAKIEEKQTKVGFQIVDRTPAGYGPRG